jgi:alpha-L-fucosidase
MVTTSQRGVSFAASALLGFAGLMTWSTPAVAQTRYPASWSSLDAHNPAPDWFQDAKFGVYYHWGAFGTC